MDTKVEYSASPSENNIRLVTHTNGKPAEGKNGNQNAGPKPETGRKGLPELFERSSKKWWNPQMDSEVLEKQSQIFARPLRRTYFKLALIFIIISSLCWMVYYGATQKIGSWSAGIIWCAALLSVCTIVLAIVQFTTWSQKFNSYLALVIAVLMIATVIVTAWFGREVISSDGSFYILLETILILHGFMPLPMHVCFMLSLATVIFYEVVFHLMHGIDGILTELLLILCCLAISVCNKFFFEIRIRSSFWKVGQFITSNLSAEFKKIMIDSIMPKSVSEQLLGQNLFKTSEGSIFRPLYVERMSEVSILYADIVGFTKMSANKTAAELVYLLNDLFRRFDTLCLRTGCEKISTLGDCYYCVSGCPDPKNDHARCCVEMGLGMISAIKDFCIENDVNVDMRIGIHTGIVICGIVGMKRFKFDVWSNDVSFANLMEQWGVPGKIHISEETKACLEKLGHEYEIEDGKIEERVPKDVLEKRQFKTFLIRKRIGEDSEASSMSDSSSDTDDAVVDGKDAHSKVKTVNERRRTKSNGRKSENTSIKKKGVADVSQDNLADVGEGDHENNAAGKSVSHRNYSRETIQPTDPLLNVKRPSSRRHHHSTRNRSRRRLADEPKIKQVKIYELIGMHGMMPFLDSKVREKQDVEFINSIKDNRRMKGYKVKNIMHPLSLNFTDENMELSYRNRFVTEITRNEPVTTVANIRFSFYTGLILSAIFLVLVFFASLASLNPSIDNPAWLIVFIILLVMVVPIYYVYFTSFQNASANVKILIARLASWFGSHLVGSFLLLCPFFVLVSHMSCQANAPQCSHFQTIMGVVGIHFLNFNLLNSWMRSFFAVLLELIMLLLFYVNPCQQSSALGEVTSDNSTDATTSVVTLCHQEVAPLHYEYIVTASTLLLLIFLYNRISEDHFRRTYHDAYEAEANKNQSVDELLHHIIPPRVTAVIREKKTYSKDHSNVGVVFASITNFNEFYEEQYAGGKECIRILNELIGDVDELLDRKEFCDIEKIKTIGSTFMIAAGLDPNIERDLENHSHLHMLMKFCIQMQKTIQDFSENMPGFTFVLRIGFNHGSVTAGVIGTTKLLYDIWGDTVNIASRMDSTGVPGKIQVSEGSKRCLEDKYDFEHRGSTFVKGKGQMETYLVKNVDGAVAEKPATYREYT